MIRIKPNKCGYSIYQCTGLPDLSTTGHLFNANTVVREITGGTVSISDLDSEFNQLPVKIKGMVFTTDTMDMSWPDGGPHPEVPELSCRSDTDPSIDASSVSVWGTSGIPVDIDSNTYNYPVYGGTTGWVDLFNSHYVVSGSTTYFYRDKVFIVANGSTATGIATNIPVFHPSDSAEYEFNPGLLEPMLDTDFDPIQIDTIPAWEAGDDSFIFEAIVLNTWKEQIDDRIRNLYGNIQNIHVDGNDAQLRDLKNEEYKESECANFQIILASGQALWTSDDRQQHHDTTLPKDKNNNTIQVGSQMSNGDIVLAIWEEEVDGVTTYYWVTESAPNVYTVLGGTVTAGDHSFVVAEVTGLYAPFYAYLTVTLDGSVTYSNVATADLPTVVDITAGTVRPIQDGDPLLSGGTVSNMTSTGTGAAQRWSWIGLNDNGGVINVITYPDLTDDGTADPPAGSYGIGGVRIIHGVQDDPLTLFKIYHEDCITEVSKEDELEAATAGYIEISSVDPNPELLMGFTVSVSGGSVDYITPKPGIVQPVRNIEVQLDNEKRSESLVDVPSVEAVYNFIHGFSITGATDSVPVASALAEGSTMAISGTSIWTGSLDVEAGTASYAVSGTFVVAEDIKTIIVPIEGGTHKETAADSVPTAQAVVDYIEGLDFETSESQSGHLTIGEYEPIPGTTVYGETWSRVAPDYLPKRGTVEVAQEILVGATPSLTNQAVPSVNAVYSFVHSTELDETGESVPADSVAHKRALSVNGFVEITKDTNNNETGDTITAGTPGTTYVVDNVNLIGDPAKRSGSKLAVPTVEAVWNFIHGYTVNNMAISSALAAGGTITGTYTAGSTEVTGTTFHDGTPGTYYVTTNIVETSTGTSETICVPDANAVVGYVNTKLVEATAGTIYAPYDTTETWVDASTTSPGLVWVSRNVEVGSDESIRPISQEAVPTVEAVYLFVNEYLGGTTAGTLEWANPGEILTGAILGRASVARNILVDPHSEYRSTASEVVPTVEAVYAFIHGETSYYGGRNLSVSPALATPAAMTLNNTTATLTGDTPGTFHVTNDMNAVRTATTIQVDPVPTAGAVKAYVTLYCESIGIGHSIAGWLTGGTASDEAWVSTQTYPAPTRGTVEVAHNIMVATNTLKRNISPQAVPSVEAVYDFIHSDITDVPGGTASSQALATAGTMSLSGSSPVLNNAIPGTVIVADNIEINGSTRTVQDCVPTAQAVVDYVATHGGGGGGGGADPAAVGTLTVTGSGETITGSTAAIGTVWPVLNVIMNGTAAKRDYSHENAVPTVESIINYIHGSTPSGVSQDDSKATPEAMAQTGTAVPTHNGTPGTVRVATDIKVRVTGTTTLTVPDTSCVVPSAQAVVDYIAKFGPNAEAELGHITTTSSGENFGYADGSTGTPLMGSVYRSDNIAYHTQFPWSKRAVPTVYAVQSYIYSYVHGEAGYAIPMDGITGTVKVITSISATSSYQDYEVPSVAAVKAWSGGSSGDIPWPIWTELGVINEQYTSSSLIPNKDYTADANGWLRVSNRSSSCATISFSSGGSSYGVGIGSYNTLILPIKQGVTFNVGGGNCLIRFDHTVNGGQSGTSDTASSNSTNSLNGQMRSGAKSWSTQETALRSVVPTTDDPSTTTTRLSIAEDFTDVSANADEAIDNKNSTITAKNKAQAYNNVINYHYDRVVACTEYVETACEYYANGEKPIGEIEWESVATTWLTRANTHIQALADFSEDTTLPALYAEQARTYMEAAQAAYQLAMANNDILISLGVTGGETFVNMATIAATEATSFYQETQDLVKNAPDIETVLISARSLYTEAEGTYNRTFKGNAQTR